MHDSRDEVGVAPRSSFRARLAGHWALGLTLWDATGRVSISTRQVDLMICGIGILLQSCAH